MSGAVAEKAGRVAYLDGLRAVAILSVVAVHYEYFLPDSLPLFRGGYIGVDVFLVLSGYLITTLLWRRPGAGLASAYTDFLRRRFMRLYPALIGFLVVATVFVAIFHKPVDTVEAIRRAALAAVQATPVVVAYTHQGMAPFTHAWTLGWEWYFYLIWPLILLALRRKATPQTMAVGSAAAAVLLYATGAATSQGSDFYLGPWGRAAQLLVGAAVAFYLLDGRRPSRLLPGAAGVIGGVALLAICAWTVFGQSANGSLYEVLGFPVVTISSAALVLLGRQCPGTAVNRLLSLGPITLIGRVSYSLYLLHLIPGEILDVENTGLPQAMLGAVSVVLVVVLVTLSYRYLEKPFMGTRTSTLTSPPVPTGTSQAMPVHAVPPVQM